jgi:hypothetical protein
VRRALARRATRYGLNAAILVVLILGVIVLVEAVSYRHSYRVDLTENKRWSLSPQTVKVVSELPVPVKAWPSSDDQPGKRTAESPQQYAGAGRDSPGRSSTRIGTRCGGVRFEATGWSCSSGPEGRRKQEN